MLKVIHAVILFSCLLPFWEYGYYQFVRFISMCFFGYFAYQEHQKGNETKMFIYIGLAILFQPLFKIALGRFLWNVIDVIAGGWLIIERE